MERTVTVRTPESIAFTYELAGLGSRFLAVSLDQVIQIVVLLGFFFLWVFATGRIDTLAAATHLNRTRLEGIYLAILIVVVFIVEFGYFIFFEMRWNGQTPGKRLLGIRVVRDGGYAVDFMAVLLRNLIRVLEATPPLFYAPSAISVIVNQQNKRLGDLAAGTIVVRDRAFEVTDPKRWFAGDEVAASDLVRGVDRLTPEELALVQRYVERRTLLPPGVAGQSAARIASSLRPKLGPETASLGNDELLVRIAASRRR